MDTAVSASIAVSVPQKYLHVDLLHRAVPAMQTLEGVRALSRERAISPDSVERYLHSKFGESLDNARRAMTELARSLPPEVLADRAYALYERFRPEVPPGVGGWGAAGTLDLGVVGRLARREIA